MIDGKTVKNTALRARPEGVGRVVWSVSFDNLVRHQDRQARMGEDVARRAAEHHLTQTALGVGAFDQKVGA